MTMQYEYGKGILTFLQWLNNVAWHQIHSDRRASLLGTRPTHSQHPTPTIQTQLTEDCSKQNQKEKAIKKIKINSVIEGLAKQHNTEYNSRVQIGKREKTKIQRRMQKKRNN